MALTEVPHRGALDLDPGGLIQIHGQLFIGPVRPMEPTPPWAFLHPTLDHRRPRLGNPPRLSRCPLDLQALQAPFMIVREPEPHGRAMHPQILGDGLALATPTGHQDRLAPVAESSVVGRLEGVFQLLFFRGRQPHPPHLFRPLSHEKPHERVPQKRCKITRCLYKVAGNRSPYDGDWVYWSTRRGRDPTVGPRLGYTQELYKNYR